MERWTGKCQRIFLHCGVKGNRQLLCRLSHYLLASARPLRHKDLEVTMDSAGTGKPVSRSVLRLYMLQLISTGHSLVDDYMTLDTDEYARLWKYTGDTHYREVSCILLHNTKNMLAMRLVPLMVAALDGDANTARIAEVLGAWDFRDEPDAVAPTIFQAYAPRVRAPDVLFQSDNPSPSSHQVIRHHPPSS